MTPNNALQDDPSTRLTLLADLRNDRRDFRCRAPWYQDMKKPWKRPSCSDFVSRGLIIDGLFCVCNLRVRAEFRSAANAVSMYFINVLTEECG
jgi:hypothetical protein